MSLLSKHQRLMLSSAALALAASLLSALSPLVAAAAAATIFVLSLPILDPLQSRLQNAPARLAAAGVLLLALYGILG